METKYLDEEINYLEMLQKRDELTDNGDNKLIEFRMIKVLLSELKKLRVGDVIKNEVAVCDGCQEVIEKGKDIFCEKCCFADAL